MFFFFNDTATTEIYTLSLHDALPISLSDETPPTANSRIDARSSEPTGCCHQRTTATTTQILLTDVPTWPKTSSETASLTQDRKSTRLNSSHANISYAVFCLKKKKKPQ